MPSLYDPNRDGLVFLMEQYPAEEELVGVAALIPHAFRSHACKTIEEEDSASSPEVVYLDDPKLWHSCIIQTSSSYTSVHSSFKEPVRILTGGH